MITRFRKIDSLFLLLLAIYGLYSSLFIYHTSFVVGDTRYFSLFDDAMVSMRYARNLAHGYGLVWNPGGELVEGFTNPLWVLYMAAWHLPNLPANLVSLPIQISSALFLLLNLFVVRRITLYLAPASSPVSIWAVLFTAFYLPLNNWSLQGMEVGLLTLLLSIVTLLVLRGFQTKRSLLVLYLILAISLLIRIDMAAPFLAVWSFCLVTDKRNRPQHLLYGLIVLVICLGGQTLARLMYYGDPLPNTYYLKMTGYPTILRLQHGLAVFIKFVASMNVLLFIIPWLVLLARRDRSLVLLCLLFWVQVAYSIYVGGDAWEDWGGSNRYISPVMPLFMILLCYSFWIYLERLRVLINKEGLNLVAARTILNIALLLAVLIISVVLSYFGFVLMLMLWVVGLLTILLGVVLAVLMRFVAESGAGRRLHGRYWVPIISISFVVLAIFNLNSIYRPKALDVWVLQAPLLHVPDNKWMVEQSQSLTTITTPGAIVAVVWAGTVPYYADREMLDLLGKADRHIARAAIQPAPGTPAYENFRPGHLKWDYGYSIGEKNPDIVAHFWQMPEPGAALTLQKVPLDAAPYITAKYQRVVFAGYAFYARVDSSHVRWDLLGTLP